MKPLHLAIAIVGFLGAGAGTFLVVRGLGGAPHGGAATREGLVAATVAGVNAGDREALLDIMVGPPSDRIAAECDNDQDSSAHDQSRAARVDDALDEAKRRKLVLDHIGDDHAEVVLKKGQEIDKHCTARVDVVKHQMEVLMHDGKDIQYRAQLVGMEIAGRWYLATIPLAEPVGGKLATPVASAPPPPDAAAPPPPDAAPPPPDAASPLARDVDGVPAPCVDYMKELDRLAHCATLAESLRTGFAKSLQSFKESIAEIKTYSDVKPIAESCQKTLDELRQEKMGC